MRILPLSASLFLVVVVPAQDEGGRGRESKAKEAEYKAKGMVEVDGVYVPKAEVADAKKGIYHHEGDVVNRFELQQLRGGKVRHRLTGRFIDAADLGKAGEQFPVAAGAWASKDDANKYHSDPSHPWVVRTTNYNVISTLPLDTILYQIAGQADAAFRKLMPVVGGATPPPDRRPTILVLGTQDEYAAFGADHGDGGSAHGAFLAPSFSANIDGSRSRVAAVVWDKDWGPYYVRHAAGLALCHALCGDETDDVPEWFQRAVGGYVERHFTARDAKFFGEQHEKKGGVKDLSNWLSGFKISPDLPARGAGDIGFNIYQAGLLLSYCTSGTNKAATDALQKVTDAFAKGQKVAPSIKALGKVIAGQETDVKAYFARVLQ